MLEEEEWCRIEISERALRVHTMSGKFVCPLEHKDLGVRRVVESIHARSIADQEIAELKRVNVIEVLRFRRYLGPKPRARIVSGDWRAHFAERERGAPS